MIRVLLACIGVVVGVVLGTPVGASADPACKIDNVVSPIVKVSEYLYKTRCANDLFLVMERVDDAVPNSSFEFWDNYAYTSEESDFNRVIRAVVDGDPNLPRRVRDTGGLTAFQTELLNHKNNELWVVYATPNDLNAGVAPQSIEMYMAVTTTAGAPMVKHNGISRSSSYDLEIANMNRADAQGQPFLAEQRRRFHKNLAPLLHSFSAKVMLMRDSAKLYMIAFPLDVMRRIIRSALPNDSFDGDSLSNAAAIYEREPKSKVEREYLELLDRQDGLWEDLRQEERGSDRFDALRLKIEKLSDEIAPLRFELEQHRLARVQAIANEEGVSTHRSPVVHTLKPQKIKIYDRSRSKVVFSWNEENGKVRAYKQSVDVIRYKSWFRPPGFFSTSATMTYTSPLTVNLDALAKYGFG